MGLAERRIVTVDMLGDGIQGRCMTALHNAGILNGDDDQTASGTPIDKERRENAKLNVYRRLVSDKLSVLLNVEHQAAIELLKEATFVVNRQGRVKNAITPNGEHIASPRLGDGGLSLTDAGAVALHRLRTRKPPTGFDTTVDDTTVGAGPAWVVVDDDAEPFVRQGRNVFHGFVMAVDHKLALSSIRKATSSDMGLRTALQMNSKDSRKVLL